MNEVEAGLIALVVILTFVGFVINLILKNLP